MNNDLMPVIYGEVLFDCFPEGDRVLGGAPFNVAWHCQAFGLNPLFVSRVGDDELGREIISAMRKWGMDTSGVQIDSEHKTGMVEVTFENGEPLYHIIENSSWDFIDHNLIPELQDYSFLYHGSLALRNIESEKSLEKLQATNTDSIFIDVNLRPPWWNLSKIKSLLNNARWVKLNQDELSLLVPGENEIILKARHIIHYYKPELVVVTLGEAGAVAVNDKDIYTIEPESTTNVIDTVGAGDAFTSVLLLGLYKAWPLQIILERAQKFASKIVGIRGATTSDKSFYQSLIKDWNL